MGKIKGKGISAGVMGVLAGVLLIVSLVCIGWYYISTEFSGGGENYEGGVEFGLSEARMYSEGGGESEEETEDYDEADEDSKVLDVFSFVKVFVIIGMILTFIFAILAFLAGARLVPGPVPLLVGIIAAIAVIVGPVYMIFALPDAWDEDGRNPEGDGPWNSFWGSDSESAMGATAETSWGPYWCWYMTAGVGIILFSAAGMCKGIKRKRSKRYEDDYPPVLGYGRTTWDSYDAPPQHSRDPYDDPRGPPPRSRDPYDDPRGPPPRSRDPYDDPRGPPPRSRDPYDDPRGPPPRLRDPYNDPYGSVPPPIPHDPNDRTFSRRRDHDENFEPYEFPPPNSRGPPRQDYY